MVPSDSILSYHRFAKARNVGREWIQGCPCFQLISREMTIRVSWGDVWRRSIDCRSVAKDSSHFTRAPQPLHRQTCLASSRLPQQGQLWVERNFHSFILTPTPHHPVRCLETHCRLVLVDCCIAPVIGVQSILSQVLLRNRLCSFQYL